jgi:hypothetical protein
MPISSNALRVVCRCAGAALLAGALAGCSEYTVRRDAISLNAGDAVMTDRVTHMVDPWPRDSADRNIAFNGERMESAVERYRTGRVIPPVGIGTGNAYQAPPAAPPANTTPVGPTVTQSAPVK